MFIRDSTRRRRQRVGAVSVALMQIGVFAVVSPVDALLHAERFGLSAHVESPDDRACATQHNHLFCQVVRSLLSGIPASGIAVSHIPAPSIFTTDRPDGHVRAKSATFLIGAIIPRGPPVA